MRDPVRMPDGRSLKPRERARLIGEILAAYAQARRALRSDPIEPVVAGMRSGSSERADRLEESSTEVGTVVEAARLGRAVARTLRFVPGDTRCLVRSLVLTRLLARREIPATFVIGARTEPKFLAHAWVECAGHAVLDPGDDSFGRLVEL